MPRRQRRWTSTEPPRVASAWPVTRRTSRSEALSAPVETTRGAEGKNRSGGENGRGERTRTEATVTELETRTVEDALPSRPRSRRRRAEVSRTPRLSWPSCAPLRQDARSARDDRAPRQPRRVRRPGGPDPLRPTASTTAELLDTDESVGTALIQARAKSTIPLDPVSTAEDIAASGDDGGLDATSARPQERAALAARGLVKETV